MAVSMAATPSSTEQTVETEERHESDLYTRPGWVDADLALAQINQGKAIGDRGVLWMRGVIQKQLRILGGILDTHAGKFLFVSLLALATFSVGLKSLTFHSDIEVLWAEPPILPESTPKELMSTHQMLIHTANDPNIDLLSSPSLLEHLDLLQKAMEVTVNMFDMTWRLKDFCRSPDIPYFDNAPWIEQIFDLMMPCSIITPLDCFWEGSKLLGPEFPVHFPNFNPIDENNRSIPLNWTNLNPWELAQNLSKNEHNFDYLFLEDYLTRSGITTGYQYKPCLNPTDPGCPKTSPNKNSSLHSLDIGAELTGGCHGLAAKYMHWPEDLMVGGTLKNKSGYIKQAKALQSVVQLMGEHELYEALSGHYKVHHIGWTQEKASQVLNEWQKKFALEVKKLSKLQKHSSSYSFVTFSTANVNEILKEYSKSNTIKLGLVLVVVTVYSWIVHSLIAALGVLVLASITAAALGVCSLIGLPMNLLSTQVLPYISVGLALSEMFLLLSVQRKNLTIPDVLVRTGPSIIAVIMINSSAFLVASVLPVPALRVFAMQCAVMVAFHGAALLFILPTLLALEQRCEKSDVPCFRSDLKDKPTAVHSNEDPEHGASLLTSEVICQQKNSIISYFVTSYFSSVLMKPFVKGLVILAQMILLIFLVFNALKIKHDVRLSSFVPKNTQEYRYLDAHNKYFGFYNFYLVTTELEYPLHQPLLHEYHSALTHVPYVLKDSNGGLNMNDFWLANFREYLIDLEHEFNRNLQANCLNGEKWFSNASEKAVLAFKLRAQTGTVESPVNKGLILDRHHHLVRNGVINTKAFYNYLSVWSSNDQMSYSSAQANFTPKPQEYYSSKSEYELKIPKSQPLTSAQMPFYLKNLKSTADVISALTQIKEIAEEYSNRGFKTYPIGTIFAYFNQFLMFDKFLGGQAILTFIAAALVTSVLVRWSKLWCPFLNTITTMLVLCLFNLNAMSGIMGALHFIVVTKNILVILLGYLSAVGNRERRVKMSLELNSDALLKGDVGLLICVLVLSVSPFEFISDHLFVVLALSVGTSIVNTLVFLPLMLVLVGPEAELTPTEHKNRISTPPPPPPSPVQEKLPKPSKTSKRNVSAKPQRQTSLTTITEESCNQSIVVEPQVTVELSSPDSSCSSGLYTTKVTATANIKVELVAPVYRTSSSSSSSASGRCGGTKCHRNSKCYRSKPKQAAQQQCKCCNKDSDSSDSTPETEPCPSS